MRYGKRTNSLAIKRTVDNPLAIPAVPEGCGAGSGVVAGGRGMHARNEEFLHASRVTRPRIWTGLLLNESYNVGSLVEQGAATEIYDGTEVSTGDPVALKILLPQLAEDAKTRALFLDEARALRRLSQPGLLRYRACARDPDSDLTYIVTDVVGMRLSSRLANRKLGEDDIVALTKRLALALSAAHGAGVIHRGLRPHAIALPQGRLSDATITDFNLIKTAHSGLNAAFDDAMVDHDYCAPEQSSKSGEGAIVGPWTDVYSLALVILFALGGKQSEADRKANPDLSLLPKKLRPVFERMLESKPSRRLQSMDDVVKQIDLGLGSAPLRSLLARAPSVSLPRFGRTVARETPSVPTKPVAAPPAKQMQPASPPPPPAAKFAAPVAPPPKAVAPPPKAVAAAPVRPPLPPLPESLRPAPAVKPVPLGKFHEARTSIGLGGVARRAAVALSALLLAASPWIIQTSFPSGPADASVPPPAKVQTASKANQAPRTLAPLPPGRVYGADNTYSRITLRFHRPTRVTVHGRGERLLFSRAVQPGDSYRAPSLTDLTVTTEDAGAVEVLFNGSSAGFIGAGGVTVEKASLTRLASLAPQPAAPPTAPAVAVEPPAAIAPEQLLTAEEAEAVAKGLAALEEAANQSEPAQAVEPVQSPAPVEQTVASARAPEPQSQPAPPIQPTVANDLPEPPASVAVTPSRASAVAIYVPPPPQLAPPQPAAEPQTRRSLLGRLLPGRGNRPADPVDQADAKTLILAPAISKEAADRANKAAEMAKAANEAARKKASAENRAREGSFFNSTLGIASPY